MARGLFISGTDTGVGKTLVAVALLGAVVDSGRRAVGMKPVAAGMAVGAEANADVEALLRAGNVDAPLRDRNPFAFAPAIAPHLAAAEAGTTIDLAVIRAAHARLAECAEFVVVEGAGGVLVPISAREDMLDIAVALRLPVLLVVGMRLGCLNHALLSAAAIAARGLRLSGWIANGLERGMPRLAENVADLAQRLGTPPIIEIAWHAPPRVPAIPLERLDL